MTLTDIINRLDLKILTQPKDFSHQQPTTGYAADLLSCVMSGAKHGGIWVTLQAHLNIVAVASLVDASAVIITEGTLPDAATIACANQEGVTLMATQKSTFYIVGKLWELGLRAE